MIRLVCALLGVSLLGSSAAFAQAAIASGRIQHDISTQVGSGARARKLTDFAVNNLSAVDGSTLTLTATDHRLAREISVPDGRNKKTLFVLLNDSLGTVSEGSTGDNLNVAGVFRVNETGIAVAYADGRSEVVTLNGAGGISMVMKTPTGEAICRTWYPTGHRFSVADRKAALAEYARGLGLKTQRRNISGLSPKAGCALAPGKDADAPPRPGASPAVYSPPSAAVKGPAKGSAISGQVLARALIFYARWQAANMPPADPATVDGNLNNNPAAGFENFYVNFLAAHEGGYTENDGNGSPANFGINQGANPDIDVLNLTQAEAKQILHDRYWVASGADRLPSALAAVHGDTAINMGVGAANELLAQSGGDPQRYLDLRDARYRTIATPDSDRAKYLPVWLGRNEDLRNYAGANAPANEEQSHAALSAFPAEPRDWYSQVW